MIAKSENRNNSYFFQRAEKIFRKLIGKTFIPEKYIHDELDCLYSQDIYIEELIEAKAWHKTYIILGVVK